MWVAFAEGVLADDAVALMNTSDAFFKVGVRLATTEADAAALRVAGVSDAVASRARARVATFLADLIDAGLGTRGT